MNTVQYNMKRIARLLSLFLLIFIVYLYTKDSNNPNSNGENGDDTFQLVDNALEDEVIDDITAVEDDVIENTETIEDGVKKDTETEKDTPAKKLPGVIVVGVKKCGTGAMIEMLKMHPMIAGNDYAKSEIPFFAHDELYQQGLEYYKDKMPLAKKDQTVVIKTPGMIDVPGNTTFLERLRQAIPDIKLLMVVKNPIDRVVSDVLHEFKEGSHKGEPMPPIDDVIMDRAGYISAYRFSGLAESVLFMSDYNLQYNMLTAVFKQENILVVNGDMIVQNPFEEIKKVEQFIGLPPFYEKDQFIYPEEKGRFPCFKLGKKANCMKKDKGREHPPLNKETYDYLKTLFKPNLVKFEQQTGITFKL